MEMYLPVLHLNIFSAAVGGFIACFLVGLVIHMIVFGRRSKHLDEIRERVEERLKGDHPRVEVVEEYNCLIVYWTLQEGTRVLLGDIPVKRKMTPHQVWFTVDKYANVYGKLIDRLKPSWIAGE